MILKHLILFATTILCVSSNMSDIEDMYHNFSTQIERFKKSMDLIKIRLDVLSEENRCSYSSPIDSEFSSQVFENFDVVQKSLYDLNNQPDKHENKYDDMEMEKERSTLVSTSTLHEKYSTLLEELYALMKSEENLKQKNVELKTKYLESVKNNEATKNDLLTDLNAIKQSGDSLKQKNTELEEKFEEALKNYENSTKTYNIAMRNCLLEEENYDKQPLFDARIDKPPEENKCNCIADPNPVDCQTATKCTQKSGYYKINIPGNKTEQIMVYCDMETYGGGWLHIIRRMDGSENFNRNWTDYVNGFGKVEGEYWIGLDNLHALTNNNGQQQLYAYIENFEGESRYALHYNFAVGNASEFYKLRPLGTYKGTAGDQMDYNVGQKFSTFDVDNDNDAKNCALNLEGGWWHKACTLVLPTGPYLDNNSLKVGVKWYGFSAYSHKLMFLMIRKLIL